MSFIYIADGKTPDHTAISRFRCRVAPYFDGYMDQLLVIAAKDGILNCEDVRIDGTKIKARASSSRAFSYKIVCEIKEAPQNEIGILQAKEEEEEEDGVLDDRHRTELEIRERKLEFVQNAKEKIEARRGESYAAKMEDYEKRMKEREEKAAEKGEKPRVKQPAPPSDMPRPKDQVNLTDADSKIMRNNSRGWDQSYNCQLAVDGKSRLVVGGHVSQNANDVKELVPMFETLGELPAVAGKVKRCAADAGYFSAENVLESERRGLDAYIAAGRIIHRPSLAERLSAPAPPAETASVREKLQYKLGTEEGRAFYGRRKETVEPVFGIIKKWMNFREFARRGLVKVKEEWNMAMFCNNVKRMHTLSLMAQKQCFRAHIYYFV
jgi:hypothetical protein